MKMFKAVKKLWSRKRKRRSLEPSYPEYSSQYCHCYYSCSSTQPSAPPLPPWLQAELTQDAIPPPEQAEPFPLPQSSFTTVVQQPAEDTNVVSEMESQSYQQYTVPNPVYGVPVVIQQEAVRARRERSGGFFGFVIDFGVNIIRCLCPCFSIREEVCRRQ